jgi:NAD-dependent dihydropyrimidine dehydrogenase PreA subunit
MKPSAPTDAGPAAKLALLYFSGTGGTKVTAELLGELLSRSFNVSVRDIGASDAVETLNDSDFPVFLYPTYFLRPAPSMSEFISRLGPYDPPHSAYIVTTDELYAENSIRACALALKAKGIEHIGSKTLRSPGSDVTCIVPSKLTPWLYRFERKYPEKLLSVVAEIRSLASTPSPRAYIPRRKWYTPFAQLLQLIALNGFEKWKDRYRVLPDRCTLCGSCAAMCHRSAWNISGTTLTHLPEKCELCTRCIHRCPARAIVLLDSLRDNDRLNLRLYASLKAEAKTRLQKTLAKIPL